MAGKITSPGLMKWLAWLCFVLALIFNPLPSRFPPPSIDSKAWEVGCSLHFALQGLGIVTAPFFGLWTLVWLVSHTQLAETIVFYAVAWWLTIVVGIVALITLDLTLFRNSTELSAISSVGLAIAFFRWFIHYAEIPRFIQLDKSTSSVSPALANRSFDPEPQDTITVRFTLKTALALTTISCFLFACIRWFGFWAGVAGFGHVVVSVIVMARLTGRRNIFGIPMPRWSFIDMLVAVTILGLLYSLSMPAVRI